MPRILKRFMKTELTDYKFLPAEQLPVGEEAAKAASPSSVFPEFEPEEGQEMETSQAEPEPEPGPEEDLPGGPIDFAHIQAQAILADARREAETYREKAREDFEQELEELRKKAREEAYSRGFAEGMADAMQEARLERTRLAREQSEAVREFLEQAVIARDQILDDSREELKELALAIAEKVIRISLKGSGDILRRMVEAATDKHKRCEWAQIYIADCDVKGSANTIPELTAALQHISSRVRVIPMADDESGTCVVELPDVILDASVSTQLGNIREVLSNTPQDQDKG